MIYIQKIIYFRTIRGKKHNELFNYKKCLDNKYLR
jgi:hypothetical protein